MKHRSTNDFLLALTAFIWVSDERETELLVQLPEKAGKK